MSLSSSTTLPPWKQDLFLQLNQIRSIQCTPFEILIADYADLWHAHHVLGQQLLRGGGGLGTGTGTSSTLSITSGINNNNPSSITTSPEARIKELELRIEQLQQDLVAKYRAEAKEATSQLQLEAELRRLQQVDREKTEALDRARAALREKTAQLEEESRSAGKAREEAALLRNELIQLRRRLERSEAQVRTLTKENSTLIDRVMTEKMAMVEEMNRMTVMYQELQEKHTATMMNQQHSQKQQQQPQQQQQQKKTDSNNKGTTEQQPPPPKDFLGISPTLSGAAAALRTAALGALATSNNSAAAAAATGDKKLDDQPPAPLDLTEAFNEAIPSDPAEIEFRAHESETPAIQHDETGRLCVTAACDGTVRVWDCGIGVFTLKATLRVPSVASSESNNTAFLGVDCRAGLVLGAGSDRAARLWSLETERCLHTLTGHVSKIYACALTSDGRHAITGGTDRKVMIWDCNTGYRLRTISCGSICNSVAVSDDNVYVVSGHQDKSVRMWDMRDGKSAFSITNAHEGPVCCVNFFPGVHRLLTSSRDDSICVVDVYGTSSSPILKRFTHPDYHAGFNWSTCRLSPGSSLVAAPSNNGKVFIWKIDSGALVSVLSSKEHKNPIEAVSWSPLGGGRICTVDKEGYCSFYKYKAGVTPVVPPKTTGFASTTTTTSTRTFSVTSE
jgi:WD40 repeat protein